jgi:hypothetical protein
MQEILLHDTDPQSIREGKNQVPKMWEHEPETADQPFHGKDIAEELKTNANRPPHCLLV